MYLRRLEQRYMGEEMNHTQQLPWLVYNILFCYEGKKKRLGMRARESSKGNSKEAYNQRAQKEE